MLFRDKIQEAFDNTDDDGRTDMPTISFDYRYSKIILFDYQVLFENQPFMQPTVKQKMVKFQRTVVEPEFKKAISDGIVEEIYWETKIYIGGH